MTICCATIKWKLPTEKPIEPISCLAMFKQDNDWGITADYPIQIDFDCLTAFPQQFTWYDGWWDNVVVDDAIICWCELPTPPAAELLSA